jgi:hypothetical protein
MIAHTGRTLFNETWLTEMPRGVGSFELYDMIEYNIKDLKKHNHPITSLPNNLFKVDLRQTAYYWYERGGVILLAAEFEKLPQGWIVRATGKNPAVRGKAPWASDLYDAVLKDSDTAIRILSDNDLSDEGYGIWKRLFQLGHKISVYDANEPGKTFQSLDNADEFEKYFKDDDTAYRRYQFILTETVGEAHVETRSQFQIRRHRELINSTEDYKTKKETTCRT